MVWYRQLLLEPGDSPRTWTNPLTSPSTNIYNTPLETSLLLCYRRKKRCINNAFQILEAVELTHLPSIVRRSSGCIKAKLYGEHLYSYQIGMNKISDLIEQTWNTMTVSDFTPRQHSATILFVFVDLSVNKEACWSRPFQVRTQEQASLRCNPFLFYGLRWQVEGGFAHFANSGFGLSTYQQLLQVCGDRITEWMSVGQQSNLCLWRKRYPRVHFGNIKAASRT